MIDSGLIRFRGNIVKGIGYGFHTPLPPPKKNSPPPLSHISLHRTVFSITKFREKIWQINFSAQCTLPLFLNYKHNRALSKNFECNYVSTNPFFDAFIRRVVDNIENYKSGDIYSTTGPGVKKDVCRTHYLRLYLSPACRYSRSVFNIWTNQDQNGPTRRHLSSSLPHHRLFLLDHRQNPGKTQCCERPLRHIPHERVNGCTSQISKKETHSNHPIPNCCRL